MAEPKQNKEIAEEGEAEEINKEEPKKYSFNCPDCGQKLITTNEENILSKKVKCPKCDKIFTPSEDAEEIKEKPEEYQSIISQLTKYKNINEETAGKIASSKFFTGEFYSTIDKIKNAKTKELTEFLDINPTQARKIKTEIYEIEEDLHEPIKEAESLEENLNDADAEIDLTLDSNNNHTKEPESAHGNYEEIKLDLISKLKKIKGVDEEIAEKIIASDKIKSIYDIKDAITKDLSEELGITEDLVNKIKSNIYEINNTTEINEAFSKYRSIPAESSKDKPKHNLITDFFEYTEISCKDGKIIGITTNSIDFELDESEIEKLPKYYSETPADKRIPISPEAEEIINKKLLEKIETTEEIGAKEKLAEKYKKKYNENIKVPHNEVSTETLDDTVNTTKEDEKSSVEKEEHPEITYKIGEKINVSDIKPYIIIFNEGKDNELTVLVNSKTEEFYKRMSQAELYEDEKEKEKFYDTLNKIKSDIAKLESSPAKGAIEEKVEKKSVEVETKYIFRPILSNSVEYLIKNNKGRDVIPQESFKNDKITYEVDGKKYSFVDAETRELVKLPYKGLAKVLVDNFKNRTGGKHTIEYVPAKKD